jgi:phosphatidylinositol alpha-1,6-mannosyltransferase
VVVHIHLAPAALAFAARGASLASWLCGIEAWVPLNWSHRAALQRSRVVAAISSHTIGRFRAANPVFGNLAISVCHPGIVDRQGEVRDERRGRPVALIVGRMAANERYKGHDELLDVWQQVLQRVPDAQLRIVGDGDDRARLEAKAANLALGNSVVFLGRLSDADREDEYARCTVFVMPSRDEGFGLVFIEAMRAGRACIAAEGAACEIVAHGRTGLIVSPTSTAQLTEAVTGLLGDRRLAATMGAAGRTRFLDHFTDAAFRQRAAAVIQKPVAVGISA